MLMRLLRKSAMLLASTIALTYLTFRILFTLNLIGPYATFASVLLLVGEAFGVMTMILYFVQVWDVSEPPRQAVIDGRTVDVLVPTYNEDAQLLRATLQACIRMDYPHRTFVLDDGRREEIKSLAEELGVGYITRGDNLHAKAGNLNNALKVTDGEFVIILDADHVPEKHFITRLIGYFKDEKLAFVQTPHAFYNFDSFQATHDANKRTYWEEGEMFYGLIQPGKNRFNCPIFAGSAAMFRRKALEEIGGIATETITEDMHTGMRVNAKGWKSLAITERLVAGQAAPDVTTFHSQRLRWARGNLSILGIDNPITMRGLTMGQRLSHFASCMHWLGGIFRLPLYLTPILFLFTGVAPVSRFNWALLALTALYLLMTWTAVGLASKGRFSFWNSELFDMMSFWTKTQGAVQALFLGARGKFIVTSKRGRQSKSVWPLLRPHLILVVATVLALACGWGRIGLGLSDDWGKLVLATMWALFYLSLAFVVIRRGLAPDDSRYDYRHPVNLGLTYRVEGAQQPGPARLGLTLDVSEGGLGILTYEPLEPDSLLKIELHGAGETLVCNSRVCWTKEMERTEGMPFQGYRNGAALQNLTPTQLDVLQQLCTHYAVSRQYHEVALGNPVTGLPGGIPGQPQVMARGLEGRCFEFHLPLVLETPDDPTATAYCCTEIVAQSGMKVLLPDALAVGSERTFQMGTPLGDIHGSVSVVRYDMLQLGGRVYYLCTLSFTRLADGDRDLLKNLVDPSEHRAPLLTVLKPRRLKRRLPLAKPALVTAATLLPLAVVVGFGFAYHHRDDLLLRDIAAASSLQKGAQDQLRRITEETEVQAHPSTDRLVLLRQAWRRLGDDKQVEELTDRLAQRDPNNLELQIALFDVNAKNRNLTGLKEVHQHITTVLEHRFMPRVRQRSLLLVVARACVHAGDYAGATDYFRQALDIAPEDRLVRKEYAGVLLRDDRPEEVLGLYTDEEKNPSERFLIASAYRRMDNHVAAERECRLALKEKPEDVPARLLLAETLRATGQLGESNVLYAGVAEIDPDNEQLRMRLAFDAVGAGKYSRALELFRPMLMKNSKRSDLIRGFIDAASGAETLSVADTAIAVRIHEQGETPAKQTRVFLDRLAWVLQTGKEYERSVTILRQLLKEDANNRSLRLRLALCLESLKRRSEALDVLATLNMDNEALRLRAGMSLRDGDFDAAEKACRDVLSRTPSDVETLNLLAVTLVAKKDFKGADAVYANLATLRPDDKQVPIRRAEVVLWDGDHVLAVLRYRKILAGNIEQTAIWGDFIDAAAGCKTKLVADDKKLALELADVFRNRKDVSATARTRLAYVLLQASGDPATPKGLVVGLLMPAVKSAPADPVVRKELASVLAAAGLPEESLKIYRGLTLTFEEQRQLVNIHSAAKDFDSAEKVVRQLIRERPDDLDLKHLLADVLTWAKRYDEASVAYRDLLEIKPGDLRLQASMARIHLWGKRYDEALALYRKVLTAKPELTEYYAGYIDSAASASKLTVRADRELTARLATWASKEQAENLVLLKRLTWVCQRVKDRTTAVDLLGLAIKLDPADDKLVLNLADTLYELGEYAQAETQYLLARRR